MKVGLKLGQKQQFTPKINWVLSISPKDLDFTFSQIIPTISFM